MKFDMRLKQAAIVGLSTLLLAGCNGYYMVRDPSTDRTYFSRDIDRAGNAGAVRFKDERSESVVTLPASEVTSISAEEYRSRLHGR